MNFLYLIFSCFHLADWFLWLWYFVIKTFQYSGQEREWVHWSNPSDPAPFIQSFLFIFHFLYFGFRLSREMNNKKVSCEAKNNEINDPKTRTVTIKMNCQYWYSILPPLCNSPFYSSSEAPECEDTEEGDLPHRGGQGPDSVRGEEKFPSFFSLNCSPPRPEVVNRQLRSAGI